jgi:ActR/RegA family two-component response regulator
MGYTGARAIIEEMGMRRATSQPRAVVADGRPLERGLVRFLLDEAGYVVVAEAGAAHDTAEAVREYQPDVLVLNENTAVDHGVPVIADLRRTSPATKFILVTSSGTTASLDLLDEADAVIEEGAGIKELGFALESTRRGIRTEKARVRATLKPPSSSEPVRNHLRWLERMQGAAAASILIIAIALFVGPYGGLPSGPDGNRDANVHISAAFRSLDELAERVSTADPSEVGSLAATLWTQRALALASGGDVTALDEEIATTLRPLVPSMSPEAATTLLAILRDLVPGSEPPAAPPVESTITPEPSPLPDESAPQSPSPESPVPSETPPPSPEPEQSHGPPPRPSPSPEPEPTDTPSPSPEPEPTDTPSPSPEPEPSESPSPSSTETPSPSPSETPSPTTDAAPINPGLIVVPPAIGVLEAVSRSTRRRRSQRGPITYVHLGSASSQTSETDDLSALNSHSSASQQNVDDAEELVRRLTTVRAAIEEQSIRVAELEEQFKSELRRVQILRAPSENPSGADIHDDPRPPQGVS